MPSSYPELEWTKLSPSRWARGIDEVEEFYWAIAKAYEGTCRRFFGMTGFITVSVDIDTGSNAELTTKNVTAAFRMAWLRLRFDHPTLASWIEYDRSSHSPRKVYDTCSDHESRQSWLRDTFRTIVIPIPAHEWANSDPPAPEMPTLFVLKPEKHVKQGSVEFSLVFRSPHEIIDGIGTLHLLNNLLKHATNAYAQESWDPKSEFRDETPNLSPPFRIAARIPRELTKEQAETFQQMLTHNGTLQKGAQLSVLPFKQGSSKPGVHKRTAVCLSPESTRRLTVACKSVGATVTHAYHAAIVIALRDHQPKLEAVHTVRYIGYCLVNYRKYCEEPYRGPEHPVSVIHSTSGAGFAIDLTGPIINNTNSYAPTELKDEFMRVLKMTRDYYVSISSNKDSLPLAPRIFGLAIPKLSQDTLNGKIPEVPPPDSYPSVTLSSMGRIDDIIAHEHGAFKLDDPWITGEELRTSLGTFLGTWKGQLTFSATYNDAWHDEVEVLSFLKACEQIVFDGLGIDMTA